MMFIAYLIIGCIYTYSSLMPVADDIKEIYGDRPTALGLILSIAICVVVWPLWLIADIVNFF